VAKKDKKGTEEKKAENPALNGKQKPITRSLTEQEKKEKVGWTKK